MRIAFCITALAILHLALPSATYGDSFDSDGVQIHYKVDGQGVPVVLIHGYLATGDLNWRTNGVIDRLAKDYRVIALDNRGHGRSDQPTDPEAYGENMAEDVVRLMDHLNIQKAHIVGYSMGGMITLKLLANHPERVQSAIVAGMGWFPSGPIRSRPIPPNMPPAFAAKQACAAAFPTLGTTREQCQQIAVPLTVIIGEEDGLIARVEALEAIRPDIPVVRIPGANHLTCIWHEDFKSAIQSALENPPEKQP